MQDARLRVAAALLLSLAAFTSVAGAIGALIWWILFTPRISSLPRPRVVVLLFGFVAAISGITALCGGDGLSYFIRMSAIILIAGWAYHERHSGELLDVSVWLFGTGWGFDIGLVAEMGVQAVAQIEEDITAIRQAMNLKGIRWGIRTLFPLGSTLIFMQLRRAEDQAKILAVRGYRGGGSLSPIFRTSITDGIAFLFAIFIFIAASGHLRDVFIVIK
jgi:hypothetical protein